jgi:hypothetical protein
MEAGGEAEIDDLRAEQGLGEVLEGKGAVQEEAEGESGAVTVCPVINVCQPAAGGDGDAGQQPVTHCRGWGGTTAASKPA